MRRLREHPGLGHTREDLVDLKYLFYPVFKYQVVYSVRGESIIIEAVLHGARDLPRALGQG